MKLYLVMEEDGFNDKVIIEIFADEKKASAFALERTPAWIEEVESSDCFPIEL